MRKKSVQYYNTIAPDSFAKYGTKSPDFVFVFVLKLTVVFFKFYSE